MNEETIFTAAIQKTSPEQRAAFLDEACGGDLELRAQVEALLRARDNPDSFFDAPAAHFLAAVESQPLVEQPGTLIGRYELKEQIGEGGMGVVYVAKQTEPVRRKVALKIIKPGMDTRQVIARFEAERQALALMDHPNIARVLDAGATESGRPYFVMELVRGMPITDYCDQVQLGTDGRLELFSKVCQAVQHAHQKGIIHRDIKPSNVMVTLHDGVPMPKVIDFGVAKATGQRLTEESVYTHLTEMVGTPLYMSPEQAELSDLDVDTRSDVYSLGVLLYELLTGTTPFDKATLRKAGFDEIRRIIREQEPPKPSDRLSTVEAASLSTISEQRGIDPRKLTHTLRGDLDWIVMRALEKDRTRRYETASALAADVLRHLANEPIEAKRPTLVDRIAKWSRRHRTVVFSTAVILVMAVVGLTVSTVLIAHQRAETVKVLGQLQVEHQEVEQQRERAEKAAGREHRLATSAQQWSYASDIRLASAAWKDNDTQQLLALLDRHQPSPGQPDYRSFEWYFLRQQGRPQRGELVAEGSDRIWCVRQSVDGRWIATSGDKGVIKVYDARTHEPRATFLSGRARVKSIAFGPDGNTLASSDDEGTVRVWDIQKQRGVWSMSAHEGSALGVAFCPSGTLLASCGSDAAIRLWDPRTGHPLETFEGRKEAVEAIAISPDGRLLASVDRHYCLALWDLQTRQPLYLVGRHSGRVTSVVFSPDGETLVTADVDGMICVWDVPHGSRVLVKNHLDGVESVAFSPSGEWFAAADRGGNIKCWNLDGQPQRWQFGHELDVRWCAPSPDGRTVVAVTWQRVLLRDVSTGVVRELKLSDQNVLQNDFAGGKWPRRAPYHPFAFSRDGQWFVCVKEIYRVDTNSPGGWKLQAELPEGFRQFCCAAFSPDAQSLVTGMSDGRICLWDVQTGTLQSTLRGHEAKPVRAVDYSPDGQTLVSCGDDCRIILWDVATQTEWKTLTGHEDCVNYVAFSPDGDELASCGLDRVIRLWDPRTGRMTGELQGHTDRVKAVTYSPDGRVLATVGLITVRLWDPAKQRLIRQLPATAWCASLAKDGKNLLVAGGLGRDVRWWDLDDVLAAGEGPLASWHAHDGRAYSVAFSPTGDRLLSAGADGNVLSWKQFQPAAAKTLNHAGDDINDFVYVPGGRSLVTIGNDGAFLWNLQTELAETELDTENRSDSLVACSPDGKLLAVEDRERAIRLWDLERRAARTDWNPDQGSLDLLAFSPDGSMLACFSLEEEEVRLLDVPTGNTSWTFPGSPLTAVAFSPDSRILAVSDSRSRDAIHIWDLAGQNKIRTLLGHSNTVENLAFSPDGRLLASVSDDRLVKLWDWQAGTEQFSLSGHRGPVETLAFSPDGATLATAGEDGTLKLWQVASGRPLCDLASMEEAIWKVAFNESGDSLACLMRLSKQIRFFEAPRGETATPSPAAEPRNPQAVVAETLENVEALARQKERIEGIARRFTLPGKEMELSGTTVDGSPLDWSAYRGRVVLVAFWDTGDGGFHAQVPDGQLNYELYHDRGFDIVAVSLDDDRRALQQYLRREPLPWVTVHDVDAQGRHPLATYHGVIGTPRTFLIDRDGKVVSISARGSDLDKLLEELVGPPCVPTDELTHIDLQSHANWNLRDSADNGLNELPRGEQVLGGVRFVIGEAAIELAGRKASHLPERVEGIPVNSKVGNLYVLHGAEHGEVPGREVVDGDRIGRYQVHYQDNTSETIPVVYGEDVRDWRDLYRKAVTRGKVVWIGSNPRAQRRGALLRLYLTKWENPHPDKKVSHLDYISTNTTFATPFCVAITVESPATPTTDN